MVLYQVLWVLCFFGVWGLPSRFAEWRTEAWEWRYREVGPEYIEERRPLVLKTFREFGWLAVVLIDAGLFLLAVRWRIWN